MDDRDRRAPVALAADAPVAQAPGGFFLAQTAHLQRVRDRVDRIFVVQSAVAVGVDGDATLFVTVPILPVVVVVNQPINQHHFNNVDTVFLGKDEVTLIMRGHAHHRAVAIAHQHVVAHPDLDLVAVQRVRDKQACGHSRLFARGQLGFGGTAQFALVDELGKLGV
jgi:hypothetical protein